MKLLQSIFLIIGTAVGGGVLALPISTVSLGFKGSLIALLIIWIFMTYAAFNMVKARLCFAEDVDLATMTTALLGKSMNMLVELCYLILLFALVSLYITVGSAWVVHLTQTYAGIAIAAPIAQIAFTTAIAALIYSGMGNLVNVNQLITLLKLFCLSMIIILSIPQVNTANFENYALAPMPATFSMLLTTFGFSIVLPSLGTYLNRDKRKLYLALIAGSAVIILAYIAWEFVCFGVIGPEENGLAGFAKSQDKGTAVIHALTTLVKKSSFTTFGFGVILTAILTSFLGVGHCLYHYLKDALPIKNPHAKSLTSIICGFAIPVLIINLYPAGITSILSFAGIFVAAILGVLPSLMVLSKKYREIAGPLSWPHKIITVLSLVFFVAIIAQELLNIHVFSAI